MWSFDCSSWILFVSVPSSKKQYHNPHNGTPKSATLLNQPAACQQKRKCPGLDMAGSSASQCQLRAFLTKSYQTYQDMQHIDHIATLFFNLASEITSIENDLHQSLTSTCAALHLQTTSKKQHAIYCFFFQLVVELHVEILIMSNLWCLWLSSEAWTEASNNSFRPFALFWDILGHSGTWCSTHLVFHTSLSRGHSSVRKSNKKDERMYPGDPCSTLFTTWPMSHLRRYIQHVSSQNRRSLMTTPKKS